MIWPRGFTATAALLLSMSSFPTTTLAADDDLTATFTYPVDEGLEFYDGIDVIVRYECNTDLFDLRIYCNNQDKTEINEVTLVEDLKCSDKKYTMRIDFNYESDSCWYNIRDTEGSGALEVNSVEFALSINGPAETTFGVGDPTSSFAQTSTPAPPTTTKDTAAETTSADGGSDGGSDGLNTGTKIGIGVGVGVGVLGLAAFVGAFFLVRRRKNKADASPAERQELYGDNNQEPKYVYGGQMASKPDEAPPSELMATEARSQHELPA